MRPQPNRDGHHPGEHPLTEMLNLHRFVFCSGCLIGTVITSLATCLTEENLTARDYAILSGIGCTGRSSGCFKAPAFHTTHGRAIPFATGLKLAKPRIKVFVVSGDGDISAIGGNHLIHAARRNIDISVICIVEPPFNLVGLAAASGATYVARWPGYDTLRLQKSLHKAMKREGFSFIEVIVPCFTQYGRRNRKEDNIEMMEWLRAIVDLRVGCPPHEAVLDLSGGLAVCGEFVEKEAAGFVKNLQRLRESLKEG